MHYIFVLLVTIFTISCFDQSKDADNSANFEEIKDVNSDADIATQNIPNDSDHELPKHSDYPRECPQAWGMVKGASLMQVENFIQNYFHVPNNPTPMYSEVNRYSQADGSVLIKAGTYKMQDTIVDQEMVVSFAGGVMTQCGARLRCANNSSEWVESCD